MLEGESALQLPDGFHCPASHTLGPRADLLPSLAALKLLTNGITPRGKEVGVGLTTLSIKYNCYGKIDFTAACSPQKSLVLLEILLAEFIQA